MSDKPSKVENQPLSAFDVPFAQDGEQHVAHCLTTLRYDAAGTRIEVGTATVDETGMLAGISGEPLYFVRMGQIVMKENQAYMINPTMIFAVSPVLLAMSAAVTHMLAGQQAEAMYARQTKRKAN